MHIDMRKNIYKMIKNILCKIYIKLKINKLVILSNVNGLDINHIWRINDNINRYITYDIIEYEIFGTKICLDNIDWHKDYISGFVYPLINIDKIKISKWFDKGIDIKFPWEVSRFYFAIKLAQNYLTTNNDNYYFKFKSLVLDWIKNNPFCYGVNWICTMEVAIRAINWIVSINLFWDIFNQDDDFKKVFSKSLIQHAIYISNFPEIYEKGHTTNHTTANYAGLLFLALTLKEHPKSKEWFVQAMEGLEECIRYQTYDDGVNFEASIPYHRLVLEMFAYSAIVAKSNGIEFSNRYYELLFKMFEYTAAYMDHNGNAPQIGDNDSGRILIFHDSDEHDHSYLLDLGERIYDYKFKSQCNKRNNEIKQWLPEIKKIIIDDLYVVTRDTDNSIAFTDGGAYILKNKYYSLMINCFPVGQNGIGGHNHYDFYNFTLSYKGIPIIIDRGTYCYTRNYSYRNEYRAFKSHNTIQNIFKETIPLSIWRYSSNYLLSSIVLNKTNNQLVINNDIFKITYSIYDNALYINYIVHNNENICLYLYINPDVQCKYNKFIIDNDTAIHLDTNGSINIDSSSYSPKYGVIKKCSKITFNNTRELSIKFYE